MYNALDIVWGIPLMVKQYPNRRPLIVGGFVLIALIIWAGLMHEFRLDDSFITYRYARNVTRGWGLIYNQGETVLSTTAPLYALILALGSVIISDFHILGGLIGVLSIGLGAALIVDLLPRSMPLSIRLWGGLLLVLSSPLWLALGMETPLWITLVLASVYSAQNRRFGVSGLLIGLTVLVRPDAMIPGVLLGLAALIVSLNQLGTRRRWWMPVLTYSLTAAIPVCLYAIWATATYGSPFPATLSAKNAQADLGITGFGVFVDAWNGLRLIVENLVAQSPLYLVLGILALFGISRKLSPATVLIIAWGILHFLAYVSMGVAPYRWYYVPLLPGFILLATYGFDRLYERLRDHPSDWMIYLVFGIAYLPIHAQLTSFALIRTVFDQGGERQTMLPIVDWQAYREAGEWLNANTPQDTLIGVAEVGQLGFYADRRMTDYLGLLQPEVAALLKRNDLYSWLVGYAPDYLVFQRFGGSVGLALYNYFIEYDPWFVASYHEVAKFDDPRYVLGPVVIYERVLPVDRSIVTLPLSADFGPVELTGVAVDVEEQTARLRLDWLVKSPLPPDLHIGIAILDTPEETRYDGDYETKAWPGTLSTWHSFMLPEGITPGDYPLWVSIGLINGEYIPHTVGLLPIPPP
jgi:hypothetical protein